MSKPHIRFEDGWWTVESEDGAVGLSEHSVADAWDDYQADASQYVAMRAHMTALQALRRKSWWERIFG